MAEFRASHEVHALDSERILRALHKSGVEYVLIGGVACLVHGASRVTVDADVVPARDLENLARLLDALESLDAAVLISLARSELEAGAPWEVDALRRGPEALLEADAWHFTTEAGPIDVVLTAAGIGTFEEHLGRAETLDLFGVRVRVAGLDDLIGSKEALGRTKDLSVLDELRRLKQARD